MIGMTGKNDMEKINRLIFFCIVLTMASAVFAFNRPGAVSFTLGYGYEFFSAKRHIKNTSIPNIALAYNFNRRWGIEGLVGISRTHFNASGMQQVKGNLFVVDAICHFLPYRLIEPYVLAGVGVLALRPSSGREANNQSNINAGVGVQIFFSQSVALRADVRDFYTITGGGKQDVLLNAGMSFLFDA